ncbi:site-2 protease family protein [Candidatus Woesearchaeota archaeon]|nr:site-2 protease family protein [Candidatus Woesearchaeota archaeon]MBW3006263.1 site-2 protease family protein [Candidatus Woesearchaeota archaeon]
MNISNILMIGFLIALSLTILIFRKKFVFHSFGKIIYFGMYKTKVGLKLMDKWSSKYPRILTRLCYLAIGIGFIGMVVVVFDLIKSGYQILTGTSTLSVGLVLPVEAKGVFYVPFLYWIIAIAVIVVIHEFSHGLIARLHKIKVRSSGVAFLGVIIPLIPAAFVEPDEKQLRKASRFKQLSVYAAGPFANIVFGFACLGLFLLVLNPLTASIYDYEGVQVKDFMGVESPAEISGMAAGEIITQINDQEIKNTEDFLASIEGAKPGEVAEIKTRENSYSVLLEQDPAEKDAFLGVWVETEKTMKKENLFSYFIVWVTDLFYWLFLLNLGVGLFNLVPIGPIDGGRMLQTVLEKVMHSKHATRVWHTVSAVVLVIILSNVIYAFVA